MKRIMVCLLMASLICCSTSMARRPSGVEIIKPKSPGKAYLLSFVGTVAPIGIALSSERRHCDGLGIGGILFLAGTIVGPGLGHSYAGTESRLWQGIGIRSAAWVAMLIGVAASFNANWNSARNSNKGSAIGVVFTFGGIALLFGSSIYDIATADDSARLYNEKNGFAEKASISLAPAYFAQHQAPGATLTLTF